MFDASPAPRAGLRGAATRATGWRLPPRDLSDAPGSGPHLGLFGRA
jgi:hypothetical protein